MVVAGARKFDHFTLVLHQLHWLPVHQRIKYKLAMTVYKSLDGLASTYLYLADDWLTIFTTAGKQHLRSAGSRSLSVPRTRTMLGTWSFAVIWTSLPTALRSV